MHSADVPSRARVRLAWRILVLVLALGSLPGFLPAQAGAARAAAPAAAASRVQAWLDSLRAARRIPGLSVAVVFADGATLALTSGFADTAARTPLRSSDRLMQGSVGKTYVAAVALQLVAEGKLALDDPIAKHLGREPWFDRLPNARTITVRQLMRHTSGLVRYEFDPDFVRDLTAQPDRTWTPEERLAYLFDAKAPFAAGEGWEYSDTNYIVLGMILERITGQPYYDELRRRILRPLALGNTVPTDGPRVPGLAQGYAGPDNPFGGRDAMLVDGRFSINPQLEWTGGGLASTTLDLARWGKLLYEGRAFDRTLLPTMLDAVPARLGPDVRYGLAVMIRPTPFGTAWGHGGFFPGYLTELMYFPERQVSIALQVNTSAGGVLGKAPARLLLDLAAVVFGG